MRYIEEARKLRKVIEQATVSLDDQTATTAPELYPTLKQDGSFIYAGTRINWGGEVKKAAVSLWDTEENNPDNAPNLWQDIEYKDGIRIIPSTITVTTAFAKGEKGYWGDEVYTSLIDANVYTPEQYPAGWSKEI